MATAAVFAFAAFDDRAVVELRDFDRVAIRCCRRAPRRGDRGESRAAFRARNVRRGKVDPLQRPSAHDDARIPMRIARGASIPRRWPNP